MSTIELSNEWVLCRSKCGKYKGYFKTGEIPPDYMEDNKVWISAKEFINHFDLIDTCFDRSWEQTVEYFVKKNSPSECEFENIVFSKDDLKGYVINALITDIDRLIVSFGFEYDDWYYVESVLRRRDFFIVEDDYCVDDALSDLGLPSSNELHNYETTDLSYTIKDNAYSFTLKEE
jgi:hypothetical protein